MSDQLSLTPEELLALLATLGLPEPVGLDLAGEVTQEALDLGMRSLIGRGLLDPGADPDVHPHVAQILVVLLDADEIVAISVARSRTLIRAVFYAFGDVGLCASVDELGNVHLELAPAEAAVEQARAALEALRTREPVPEQYAVTAEDAKAALQQLLNGQPASLPLGSSAAAATVDLAGTVQGWAVTEDGLEREAVVVVGLAERGTWVIDGAGERALLTQLRSPWPDSLARFTPT